MDFRLQTEQEMLRDSAKHFISTEQSFEKRQRRLSSGGADAWAQFAELGWLAMAVPEEADGLGSEMADIAILCEELGAGLCVEPFIGCSVLPARLLHRAGRSARTTDLLKALAGGSCRVGVALYERSRRYDIFAPDTQARRLPDGTFRLSGKKILVAGGCESDQLIVSARIVDGAMSSPCGLLLIAANQPGVHRRKYQTLDEADVADLTFAEVTVPAERLLVFAGGARTALEHSLDEATVCLCADLLGGMSKAIDLTADYLKVRTQFGQPLAKFQALQHAVAELFIDLSDARSMLYQAIGALGADGADRRRAVSGCKIKVMEAAKSVTGTAVHLHGGIGVTCEYPVGHYLRRAMVGERAFGDEDYHLERYLADAADGTSSATISSSRIAGAVA